MNHSCEAVNFQMREKKKPLVGLFGSILCLLSAQPDSVWFLPLSSAFRAHVTWVPSLCLLLCLYSTSLCVSEGSKPLNCSLE